MEFEGSTHESLILRSIVNQDNLEFEKGDESSLTILWFLEDHNTFNIDGIDLEFNKNQILFLTEFHNVKVKHLSRTRYLRFNRPFYCILDNDEEVSCKGLLFFGASQLPVIDIPEEEIIRFEALWKVFEIEMQSKDDLQLEMLQMLLKRYLILCTRLYKQQNSFRIEKPDTDLVREFNFLVEKHFKTMHTVSEYADLLYKSPKTISNIFKKISTKTPLQLIQERLMLESRRLLRYTDKQVNEIAYEIGFNDVQSFSRFFKKNEGVSPSEYKLHLNE